MPQAKTSYKTIAEYIAAQSPEVQPVLQQFYKVIKEEAPDAEERMSWQMPTFWQHGNVVHFAAQKHHAGFYPGAEGVEHFLPKLAAYKTTKGAIQFPYKDPVPWDLVREIVRFRVRQNEEWAQEKKK